MKKLIVGIILIGVLFAHQSQGSMGLWKYTGDLSPVVDTWDVSLGGDLEMKDDKKLYFNTAKSEYMEWSTDHSAFLITNDFARVSGYSFYANTGADGSGNWEPYITLNSSGIVEIENLTQGSAGNKYLNIRFTDGLKLYTSGQKAVLKTDNLATTEKTFQFPNYSGTFITSGNLTDITTVGTIAAGTWNGTSIADANVDNNITVTGYMQDEDINTFTELQSWVSDETLLKAGTLTNAKYCTYDSASTDIICNSAPAGGDLLADGTIPMTADFNLDGNNLDNGGVIFLKEQADADADIAGQGQIWVNTATPNELWFTDDAGTDTQLGIAGSVPTQITVADESADASCYVGYFTAATGDLGPKTGTNLTFNSSTGILTATGFAGDITGALTGNASTATALAANGGNCAAGSAALGVDASGAVESCFDVWTEAENTAAGYTSNTGDVTQVFDCASGDCNTMTVGTSEYLTYGTGYIDANRFAGVTTVDNTEFGYLNGLTAAIVQAGSASHDGFSDFVANEHLDWTGDLGATNIHAGNYTNTTYLGGTNLTLAGTTFNVDDAFLANDGDVGTGVYDFGGAVVEIPNGASPTVDSVGETAIDTTSDQLVYYGSAKRVLQEEDTKCFTIESLAAADDNMEIFMADDAVTITAIGLHCAGTCTTGADISLEDRAGNAMTHTVPTHSTGSGNTTFQAVTAANTLVAGEGLRFDVDNAVSPETDTYLICFKVKYTSD